MPRFAVLKSLLATLAMIGLAGISLAGCAEEYNHGYVLDENAMSQISVGASKEQVFLVLGAPSTTSTIGGESFYYISQKTARNLAFMEPGVVDQRVLAVYFDDKGRVKEIANYGLQDGKIFDFIGRKTKTTGQDYNILSQIMHAGPSLGSLAGPK